NHIHLRTSIFFSNPPTTPGVHAISLHDALPISRQPRRDDRPGARGDAPAPAFVRGDRRGGQLPPQLRRARVPLRRARLADAQGRSEEHTSELQSRVELVCRLLLEKKKKQTKENH